MKDNELITWALFSRDAGGCTYGKPRIVRTFPKNFRRVTVEAVLRDSLALSTESRSWTKAEIINSDSPNP